MKAIQQFCCSEMALYASNDLAVVRYDKRFDEYGINVPEDSLSCVLLRYCPWCGTKLPDSKRDEWFIRLESLGFDNLLMNEDIPIEFKGDDWRIGE